MGAVQADKPGSPPHATGAPGGEAFQRLGRAVIETEAQAVAAPAPRINEDFVRAWSEAPMAGSR